MLPGLLMFLTVHAANAAVEPFWKAKEKVYDRIKNGDIIVAVKSTRVHEKGAPKNRMTVLGGGQVNAPAAFVYKKALEFDQLSKVSGYIKSATFESTTQVLTLDVGAFGYETQMKLQMKMRPEAQPKQIKFLVISRGMQGLEGTFTFDDLGLKKTEVGIDCLFRYDEFPAPQIFLEFGLEVVFQRMAASLRAYVEEEFKKGKG